MEDVDLIIKKTLDHIKQDEEILEEAKRLSEQMNKIINRKN
jgi:hypothetical protein